MKIALFQPDIAQNLGTNLRTAACLGVDVEIIEPDASNSELAGIRPNSKHVCQKSLKSSACLSIFSLVSVVTVSRRSR